MCYGVACAGLGMITGSRPRAEDTGVRGLADLRGGADRCTVRAFSNKECRGDGNGHHPV